MKHSWKRAFPAAVGIIAVSMASLAASTAASAAHPGTSHVKEPSVVGTNPTVTSNGYITFSIDAPQDADVGIEGSWGPSFDNVTSKLWPSQAPGPRTVTIGPLLPGLYTYTIMINGVPTPDPTNPRVVHSKPGTQTVLVPGKGAELLKARDNKPKGKLSTISYHSDVSNSERPAIVWTPPGYSAHKKAYPTFYLFHGGGGDYLDWVSMGGAAQIFDNLYNAGDMAPMVVVMGDGNVPEAAGPVTEDKFPTELLDNLVPAVESDFHVSTKASDRALAGLSLGGLQTFNVLLTEPGAFAYLGDMSSGYFPPVLAQLEAEHKELLTNRAVNKKTKLLRIYVGNQLDVASENNVATRALFDKYGIKYQFAGVFQQSSHNFRTWQHDLIDFVPRIFR